MPTRFTRGHSHNTPGDHHDRATLPPPRPHLGHARLHVPQDHLPAVGCSSLPANMSLPVGAHPMTSCFCRRDLRSPCGHTSLGALEDAHVMPVGYSRLLSDTGSPHLWIISPVDTCTLWGIAAVPVVVLSFPLSFAPSLQPLFFSLELTCRPHTAGLCTPIWVTVGQVSESHNSLEIRHMQWLILLNAFYLFPCVSMFSMSWALPAISLGLGLKKFTPRLVLCLFSLCLPESSDSSDEHMFHWSL